MSPLLPQQISSVLDIRTAQKAAWKNKLAKGFNTTDVPLEFCLLIAEVAEAFEAWRKKPEEVPQELADIAIFLFGIAEMTDTDLQDAVEAKLAVNEERVYRQIRSGIHVKERDKERQACLGGQDDQ